MLGTTVQLNKIISSQIAKVKIYVMYAGKNRNQTHFTKEMIEEKLVPSMYGMPIIGEFLKEKGDFGGHGGKVVISDDEIEYLQTTVAYGFIPESSQITWETVTERDGMTEREYLVADAYVWYKRFPELELMLDEPRNQSMEIEIKDAFWNDELNAYDIKDAEITALCTLGTDVEPCFESARIGRFALESMKFELSEMAKELKETLKSEVKEVSQEIETVVEETVETPEVEETVETTETEEVTQSEPEVEAPVEEEAEETQEEEPATEEATEDTTEAEEVTEPEVEQNETEVEQTETQEEQEETQEQESETEVETSETTETVDYAQENADLKAQVEAYEAELATLRAFKANIDMQEKQGVVDSFASEFTAEELQPVVEKMEQFSKEDLEIQLFAMLGRKQKQFSLADAKEPTAEKVVTMASFEVEEESIPSWARAIEQYSKK